MTSFQSQDENPYLSDPDVRLMLDFQKGDKAAFEKLMERHYKRILNFIYRLVQNADTAEDLTQEVFIKVYRAAAAYRPQAKFQTWIYQIARNAGLNELRQHRGRTLSLDEAFEGEEGMLQRQTADRDGDLPDKEVLDKETMDQVKGAIDALPENQRTAVILRRYDNLSYEDIAKTMNCSVEAVKSLLNRAKENLKNKLSPFIENLEHNKVKE